MNAHDGAGFASIQSGDPGAAVVEFRAALDLFPEHARSLVGLGAALTASGDVAGAERAFADARVAIEALRRGGRSGEATLVEALLHSVQNRPDSAIEALHALLEHAELPFTGWTIPIEPLLQPLRDLPEFRPVAARLAERAG
jgi:hypothetical protein